MTRFVHPVLFVHIDSNEERLCMTEYAIRRFFDNRDRTGWLQSPATDADVRRLRQ
ncbi:hypothetical protein [Paracoccus sp. SY]|uniref:hypothetical protein n=1 Tax=Paracoccus sp. SY TaxID=1330255 RepID=UPI001304EDC3|nr:hypothetical protein [Paracoccus sp. SY]